VTPNSAAEVGSASMSLSRELEFLNTGKRATTTGAHAARPGA